MSTEMGASYQSAGDACNSFMARSSRETRSGFFSSQLPDGMCFGRVWFIQSCPSVFFSPEQLVGKVYPSLQADVVSCV